MSEEPDPPETAEDLLFKLLKSATVVNDTETEQQLANGVPVLCIRVGEVPPENLFADNLIRQCSKCGHDVYLRPFFQKAVNCVCSHCVGALIGDLKPQLDAGELNIALAPMPPGETINKTASMEKLLPHLKEFVTSMGQSSFEGHRMELSIACLTMEHNGKPEGELGTAVDNLMKSIASIHAMSREVNIAVISAILMSEIMDELADAKVVADTNIDEELQKLNKLMGGGE